MTVDWNKPLVTGNGNRARLLGTLAGRGGLPDHVVAVRLYDGAEVPRVYFADGRRSADEESAGLNLHNS